MTVWRLIPFWRGRGQIQMMIDRWLLDQCHRGLHPPVLRFYGWEPAALSLGYHQHHWPSHWNDLAAAGTVDLVRRPTGGRAVLHAGDLTYSLVLPHQSTHRRQTYEHLCGFLIQGWRSLGLELTFGTAERGYQRQVNCFGSVTAADLRTSQGHKWIGSAQAWRGHTVLQHGSMQIQPNVSLLQQVFGAEMPDSATELTVPVALPPLNTLLQTLIHTAAQHFKVVLQPQPLTAQEWRTIEALSEDVALTTPQR